MDQMSRLESPSFSILFTGQFELVGDHILHNEDR